jgi:hypothetical protein
MEFDVSTGAAYAVLYSTLVLFTILAMGAAGLFPFLPDKLTALLCLLNHKTHAENAAINGEADYFPSARNSAECGRLPF